MVHDDAPQAVVAGKAGDGEVVLHAVANVRVQPLAADVVVVPGSRASCSRSRHHEARQQLVASCRARLCSPCSMTPLLAGEADCLTSAGLQPAIVQDSSTCRLLWVMRRQGAKRTAA